MASLGGITYSARIKNRLRKNGGGAIALSTALAFALVVLGLGFIALVLIMGAQNETRNAVDSGTLNLGKQALDQISSSGAMDPTSWVRGVSSDSTDASVSTDGKITLRRINRLWGAALLIAINADAAQNDGNAGSGESSAQQACQLAQQISDDLSGQLNQASNLYGFFTDFSTANSVRMMGLGTQTKVLTNGNWQTSLLERNDESNLVIAGSPPNFNLPPNYNLDSSAFTQCTRNPVPSGAQNMYFLKGYAPITAAGQTFWQVPFQYDEKPHLVSQTTFNQNMAKAIPLDWAKPVPNSFSAEGTTTKTGSLNEVASSFVMTNPNQPFQLSLPHSFLHIHVDDMESHWWFFPTGYPPLELDPTIGYGYTTDTEANIPSFPGGVCCTSVTPDSVTLGLEVVGQPLDGIIFNYPVGDTSKVESYMVNRINEMVGAVGVTKSASDLHSALQDVATTGELIAGVRDFYIFSPDGQNITCQPEALAIAKAPWLAPLISNTPDGSPENQIINTTDPAAIFFDPIVVPAPFCSPLFEFGWGMNGKIVGWTPGSGANGCLGTIRVNRWTDVYSLGVCNPF
ncbi:MAG: hypothetical protein P4L53_19655 [Candidatus Obscuribacterales bacterium]|nr:hypothetical protein [Candidatus Obscuribacterales bacterium]